MFRRRCSSPSLAIKRRLILYSVHRTNSMRFRAKNLDNVVNTSNRGSLKLFIINIMFNLNELNIAYPELSLRNWQKSKTSVHNKRILCICFICEPRWIVKLSCITGPWLSITRSLNVRLAVDESGELLKNNTIDVIKKLKSCCVLSLVTNTNVFLNW